MFARVHVCVCDNIRIYLLGLLLTITQKFHNGLCATGTNLYKNKVETTTTA